MEDGKDGRGIDPEQWRPDFPEGMGEIFPGRKGESMTITEMDAHGRVLLPLDIRTRLDLNAGDKLAIDHLGDGTIIITKPGKK